MTISTTMVMLTGGNLNSTVVISGVDDDLFEGAESVDLMIMSSDSAVRFSPPDLTVNIAIEDNDCECVAVIVRAYLLLACMNAWKHRNWMSACMNV